MVINRTLSKMFWPRGGAVGAFVHVRDAHMSRFQIVGIVGDTRNAGLDRETRPEFSIPYFLDPPSLMTWAVRSPLDTGKVTREMRAAIQTIDPNQSIFNVTPVQDMIEESLTRERLQSFMVSFFALAALLLAMLGIYGVVSYSVRQRTTEIGTRMAIGATTGDLLKLVMGDGLKMAAIGVGAGVVMVVILARVISQSELHVDLHDIRPFLLSTGFVAALTSLACFFPAWRATLVSPMIAIRNEPGVMWQRTRWGWLRVAEQFSGLLSRADVQAASSESDLLAEIADVSRRAGSFSEAIRAALECLRQRIGAESLALFVQREPGQPYRCHGVVPDACFDDWTLPADALIVSRLRNFAGALPIGRGELDATETWAAENAPAHLLEVAVLRDIGAAAAVRVAVKKETSGILFAGKPAGRASYSALEKRLLRGVCAQFAMMIENSRLTDRIVEQERLRRELMVAGEVQKRLFPEHSPETANLQLAGVCIPARGVGGDYYDFIDLGNRNLGIALADVAGKGIAAALVMSVVQASLRSLTDNDGVSLTELASKMNRLLYRSTGAHSYATFFYAEVDEKNRELRYVNAGHNPPYLLRGASPGGVVEELSTGGTIIGMFPKSSYEQGVVQLFPGDLLIIFTDGVPEALDPKEEEFGEDRLKEILRAVSHLPVNDMAASIVGELKKWISDAAQYDDMTFILMKVN
jgi:serine phosphatase RsbU (regulator of sigma subunit)